MHPGLTSLPQIVSEKTGPSTYPRKPGRLSLSMGWRATASPWPRRTCLRMARPPLHPPGATGVLLGADPHQTPGSAVISGNATSRGGWTERCARGQHVHAGRPPPPRCHCLVRPWPAEGLGAPHVTASALGGVRHPGPQGTWKDWRQSGAGATAPPRGGSGPRPCGSGHGPGTAPPIPRPSRTTSVPLGPGTAAPHAPRPACHGANGQGPPCHQRDPRGRARRCCHAGSGRTRARTQVAAERPPPWAGCARRHLCPATGHEHAGLAAEAPRGCARRNRDGGTGGASPDARRSGPGQQSKRPDRWQTAPAPPAADPHLWSPPCPAHPMQGEATTVPSRGQGPNGVL